MIAEPAPDRIPTLDVLLRPPELQRTFLPFVGDGLDGVALFHRPGAPFVVVAPEGSKCPMLGWDQLPAEAHAASRERHGPNRGFGLGEHHFEVRPCFAGADRVGLVVFSAAAADVETAEMARRADALTGVLAALLQAGFATWVTSELHLAASESSYRALESQNAELERAVEHLREVDKLKSNFLATVSHELRTPLTSVIGFSEMLIKGIAGDLNAEQAEYVQTILDRGEELLRLITQILEMSRIEMGAMHLAAREVPLAEIVERSMSSVSIAADQAKVTVRHELGADLPAVVVDPDKIQQIFVNLMSNAIKFNRGGGEVVVTAEPAPICRPFEEEDFFGSESDDALLVSVRDTGIGIPQEQLKRIFEAFYQVDATSTREHGGAGLGLSIVRKLVDAHGGEVWAESTVGVGTTFKFTLPSANS